MKPQDRVEQDLAPGRRIRRVVRRIVWAIGLPILSVVLAVAACSGWIHLEARGRLYSAVAAVPARPVAMVLGTTRWMPGGRINPFFSYRMDAAAELYHSGKVEYILASGDNREKNYDEPRTMQRALVERGVPEEAILLDEAGLRTLDSVVRCREVFGFDRIIIVSQAFHVPRALFLARHHGIDAVGYCARDVPFRHGYRTEVREWLARCKAILDVYILHTRPRTDPRENQTGAPAP